MLSVQRHLNWNNKVKKVVEVAVVVGKMVGGGVEAIVMAYVRHIDRSRVHFTLLVDSDSTCVPEEEITRYGASLIYVPPYQHMFAYQRALYKIFSAYRFDIVHSHINTLSVFPLLAAKKAGIGVRIADSHSTAGRGEAWKNIVKASLRPFSRIFPTKLSACSEYAGRWLYGRNAHFDILPDSLDYESERFFFCERSRSLVRRELAIENRFVVGHVGRFTKQKNHMFLLSVFAEVLRRVPDAVMLLIGQGELTESVRDRAMRMGIEEDILFLGQVNDTAALYSAMDVFLLPSLYEGMPLTVMEAQYASLPVVMSDRVTDEAVISPERVRRLPLTLTAEAWAECVLSLRGAFFRKDGKAGIERKKRGVRPQDLSDWYVSLCT